MITKILRELARDIDLRPASRSGKRNADVGYGKPPVEHQFKPGNPGGPGRPKGSKSLLPYIREELFRNDGEKAKLVAERLVQDTIRGWDHATKVVISVTTPKSDRR